MIYVGGYGPAVAKLVAVGEAPGEEEERIGRPFVGPSGHMVDNLFEDVGTSRNEVYLTNVVKHRPPGNKIKDLHLLGKSIEDYLPQLRAEIDAIQPNCILAIGGTALEALTGIKGIEKHRGSILKTNFGPYKVVPTIHPASILHGEADGKMKSWKDLTYIRWDFERAFQQSKSPDFERPMRNLIAAKNAQMVWRFFEANKEKPFVSIDIETWKTVPICIAFAYDDCTAMSIPFLYPMSHENPLGISRIDQVDIWHMVAEVLYNPKVAKIGQNFKFDEKQLLTCMNGTMNFGFKTRGFFFDTMLAFRTLYCELPGSLQFITSVLTEEPYYKDEGREYNPKKDKFDRLLLYNARDAVVTYEVFERELEELRTRRLEDFFFTEVMPLHPFYSRIESRGILRDNSARHDLREKYADQQETLQEELDELTKEYLEEPINVMSNGPKGDVPKLIFGLMKLPPRQATDEKTLDAMMRNTVKDPTKKRILELILQVRKVRKTIGTYIDAEVDFRRRLLTGYRIMLETGRTSTSILKAPVTTEPMGVAFQTVTKHGEVGSDIRRMYIPDPGYCFIEPDLSGAEARVVAILARDVRLLKAFRFEIDIHRLTKAWIDFTEPSQLSLFWDADELESERLAKEINQILKSIVSDEERQIGKKFRHAANYDMQKRTAAENAGVSEWKASEILKKVHGTNPNIRGVFHRDVQDALRQDRTLVSPNGRTRQFLNKWGDELFKEAYAQIPQSTVSDQCKKAARGFERRFPQAQILMESHDSFLAQVPIGTIDKAVPIIKEEMESPIDFSRCSLPRGELIIPCEIKFSDTNWEEMRKMT
jgi:DNA polymerase